MKNKKSQSSVVKKTIVMDEVDQLFPRGRAKFNQANFDTHQPNTNLFFYSATADRVVNQAQSLSQKNYR